MSGALRKGIRIAAAHALRELVGFTEFSAWQQTVDATSLPGWAIATPNSRHNRIDNIDTTEATPMLMVVVKRTGAPEEIEAALDDDADAITPLIIDAIKNPSPIEWQEGEEPLGWISGTEPLTWFSGVVLGGEMTDHNQIDCELTETAMRVDRSGAEPVGTLTLQFQITCFL